MTIVHHINANGVATKMTNETTDDDGRCVTGSCLCGRVRFEVARPVPNLYRCHCSLCRRQGGAAGNAATLAMAEHFAWRAGEEAITRWKRKTGFNSHFCSGCGCPVPNPVGDGELMWVPAGLLDEDDGVRVTAELCFASRAAWDTVPDVGTTVFDEVPDLDALMVVLAREGS